MREVEGAGRGEVEYHEVVIVGSGIAGIGMGMALLAEGRECTILEKSDEIGGTWRDNRYPGSECDVAAHLYSFSSAPHPGWTHTFAGADEIQAYLLRCVDDSGLRSRIHTGVTVRSAEYDDASALWLITVASAGETSIETRILSAGALVLAVGALHDRVIPDFPGLESFSGPVQHTSEWDPSTSVLGQRVGVVGTGASGVQVIPALAADAKRLTVFQRSPGWVIPRGNKPYSAEQIARFTRFPLALRAHRAGLKLQEDARTLVFIIRPGLLRILAAVARGHLKRSIRDPQLRQRLTPSDPIGCRRVTISDDYYPALERDDVDLVDSGIVRVEPGGVVTSDGAHHTLDRLVLATGFDPVGSYRRIRTQGRDGRVLGDEFDTEARTYLGVMAPAFPNLFLLLGPNTSIDHRSIVPLLEAQTALVLRLLSERDRRGARAVVVRNEAVDEFMAEVDRRSARGVWLTGCTSWYLDREGRNRTLWPGTLYGYRRRLARDGYDAYDFTPPGRVTSAARRR